MFVIQVSEDFKEKIPCFVGVAILASVKNTDCNAELWQLIDQFSENYKTIYQIEDIKKNIAIAATRTAYKSLGKDANRYRPSAEALCRRLLRGLPLYQINTLVDLINYLSLSTGYSIGGFDADKIIGNNLTLDVGKAGEPYEAIARGVMNIEDLPVYRDAVGGIGTPTSDNERTKIDITTVRLLTIINGYSGMDGLDEAVETMKNLLKSFATATDIEVCYYKVQE